MTIGIQVWRLPQQRRLQASQRSIKHTDLIATGLGWARLPALGDSMSSSDSAITACLALQQAKKDAQSVACQTLQTLPAWHCSRYSGEHI